MAKKLTRREVYIIDNFKIEPSIVKTISEIGRISGTHKYDVWLARESKKDINLLANTHDIYYIIDWAKREKPDILTFTFENALKEAQKWHKNLTFDKVEQKDIEDIDDERIIFRCSDNEHFLLLLKPNELKGEGDMMHHCVGSYKEKVKTGRSLIISLRDSKNQSYVTIELDTRTCTVVQIRGKSNINPAQKYLKMITEFAIYASGYGKTVDKEILELMNMRFD